MYDLVIIGGGPAGATAARLAADAGRVLVLEKRPAEADPDSPEWLKPCGGLIGPAARDAMARMGLSIPSDVMMGPQSLLVRAVDFDSGLERPYPRMYLNVHRGRLDRWLLSLLPDSVEVQYGARVRAVEPRGGSVTVYYRWGEAALNVEARAVVGADGAASRTRRLVLPRRPTPAVYVAMQEWVRRRADDASYTAVFDREVTDFYAWTIPKGEHLIVGAALRAKEDPVGKFRLLRRKLADRLGVEGAAECSESAVLLRPSRMRQLCPGRDRVLLVGDAAGLTSPSSGEGLSFAFRSATAAADALRARPDDPLRAYRRAFRRLRRDIGLKVLKSRVLFNPLMRRLIMRSGVAAARSI